MTPTITIKTIKHLTTTTTASIYNHYQYNIHHYPSQRPLQTPKIRLCITTNNHHHELRAILITVIELTTTTTITLTISIPAAAITIILGLNLPVAPPY